MNVSSRAERCNQAGIGTEYGYGGPGSRPVGVEQLYDNVVTSKRMEDAGPLERARENVTGLVSVVVTGIWMAALFTGQEWWLAALIVGYVVVVPVVALLFGDEDEIEEHWGHETTGRETNRHSDQEPTGEGDQGPDEALETLRTRYARGELTEEQFERKLERLLETETVEDVEDRYHLREPERE
jgi:uncharacterized membrane protein